MWPFFIEDFRSYHNIGLTSLSLSKGFKWLVLMLIKLCYDSK